jgi:hypothetical protein
MFNLLMFNLKWPSGRATVPVARVFEHTEDVVIDQFRNNDGPILERLTSLPCIFCDEGTSDEIAYVGHIDRARFSGRDISLEISFDDNIPPLRNGFIYANRIALDMPRDFEFSRNHWAVKNIDLYKFLISKIRPGRQRPIVFNISEHENIDRALVSVMMPFHAGFDAVYNSIRRAADSVGLQCKRADDIWENPAIIQDVVSLIDRSNIIVCDCTGRNPNVFYEVGIAHTLGREVILITQTEHDIPFDLRHLRHIRYLSNGEGLAALATALERKMRTISGQ